jgi:hypothetical protein
MTVRATVRRMAKLDLAPFQFAGLLGAEAVPIGHHDQAGVPQPPAATLAALISFSISAGVRYSRLRISALGFRGVDGVGHDSPRSDQASQIGSALNNWNVHYPLMFL